LSSLHNSKNNKFKFRKRAIFIAFVFLVYALSVNLIPTSKWFGELLALSLSVAIPIFLIVSIIYLLLNRKIIWLFLPIFLLLFSSIKHWIAISIPSKADEGKTIKIASFNTATLDINRFSNQSKGIETKPIDYTPMYEWMRENNDIDILCLQEFYDSFKPGMASIIDSIFKAGDFKYYCISPYFLEEFQGFFGVITFSKIEPLDCKRFIFGEDNILNKGIYLDFLDTNGDTLRILNVHLSSMSIRLEKNENKRKFLIPFSWFKDTYQRLKVGYFQRKEEMQNILNLLDSSPKNTLLCGDFNATPHMDANKKMREKFKDAFLTSGLGLGLTYNHFPHIIRIDFQYYRGDMKALNSRTDKSVKFSDHYPVITTYSIPVGLKSYLRDSTRDFE
jgi:exonuclease III